MAANINERVDNPSEAGVDRYVGLEHLDPDSLKIRRWGSPSDVEATKLRFYPGDIIFGRRRAYQRKLGVADFEGICSAHAMVLRAKPDVVLPEFLPFFMQSDLFMERALEISVGSLSPTINWKTLAAQEFALPPLDEQRRIAETLLAVEAVLEESNRLMTQIASVATAYTENLIFNSNKWVSLGEILTDTSYGSSQKSSYEQQGVPILRIPNVLRSELDLTDLQWLDAADANLERYGLAEGDILIVRTNGNPDYVGRCVVIKSLKGPTLYASYLIRLRVRRDMTDPEYVSVILNSPSLRRKIRAVVRSSAGNYNLNTQGIRQQKIPMPSLSRQAEFICDIHEITHGIEFTTDRIGSLLTVKRHLMSYMES